jgi:hypothetical protein
LHPTPMRVGAASTPRSFYCCCFFSTVVVCPFCSTALYVVAHTHSQPLAERGMCAECSQPRDSCMFHFACVLVCVVMFLSPNRSYIVHNLTILLCLPLTATLSGWHLALRGTSPQPLRLMLLRALSRSPQEGLCPPPPYQKHRGATILPAARQRALLRVVGV